MEEIEIEVKKEGGDLKLKLTPMESEPNLWMIHEKSDLSGDAPPCLRGLLMTYVDDMMIAGEESVVTSVMAALQSKWTTSTPDRVSAIPIRFLGTEITKHEVQGRDVWLLSQESYIRDLIAQGGEEIKPRKIPITRDQSVLLEELEEGVTPEKVKRAQKEVGELLWLVTRSRPELMFAVSKMGSATTKAPDQVHEVYKQAMGYLLSHPSDGLVFDVKSEDPWLLEAFADSSFSPQGEESHGAFLIKLCGCPVFWRSGRQPLISLSTAESEMMEAVESLVAGESVGVIAEELQGDLLKMAWSDNQAATVILTAEGGNWRTRHLKMRALAARQLISSGEWTLRHKHGEHMEADMGTKALTSARLEMLKKELGMAPNFCAEAHPAGGEQSVVKPAPDSGAPTAGGEQGAMPASTSHPSSKEAAAKAVLKILLVFSAIQLAKSEDGEGEEKKGEESYEEFKILMVVLSLVVVMMTVVFQWMWKVGVSRFFPVLPTHEGEDGRSHPAEVDVTPQAEEQSVPSESSATTPESSESSNEGDDPLGIQRALREIAEEERDLWVQIRADPSCFEAEYNNYQNDHLPTQVLTTRYGSVYHGSRACGYLRAPQNWSRA